MCPGRTSRASTLLPHLYIIQNLLRWKVQPVPVPCKSTPVSSMSAISYHCPSKNRETEDIICVSRDRQDLLLLILYMLSAVPNMSFPDRFKVSGVPGTCIQGNLPLHQILDLAPDLHHSLHSRMAGTGVGPPPSFRTRLSLSTKCSSC